MNQLLLLDYMHETKVASDWLIPRPPLTQASGVGGVGDNPGRASSAFAAPKHSRHPSYNGGSGVGELGIGADSTRHSQQAMRAEIVGNGRVPLPSQQHHQHLQVSAAAAASETRGATISSAFSGGSWRSSELIGNLLPVGATSASVGDPAAGNAHGRIADGGGNMVDSSGDSGIEGEGGRTATTVADIVFGEIPRLPGKGFLEGELECERKFYRRFPLNHRLLPAKVLGYLAGNTLASFAVRKNLYVYCDTHRKVFYMTLSEVLSV